MNKDALETPGLDAEYRVMREECGLAGPLERNLLSLRGSEVGDYLQGQLTNDILALEPAQGCYSALLDRKGKMQGDMRVVRVSEDLFEIDRTGPGHEAVVKHLDMYKIGRDVELTDRSGETATLVLEGPATAEVLGGSPLGRLHSRRDARIAERDCALVVTEAGVDLICDSEDAMRIRDALLEAHAHPVSTDALELTRVERGVPRFGAEMDTTTIPQEAGINERAVSFTKGCYIGQETVARLHYKGKPNRHLRGLRFEMPARAGDAVRSPERELGAIGTAVLSPAHGPIGLAILRREAEPGDRVEVGEDNSATVVELPF